MPVPGPRSAEVALAEGAEALVVDPAGPVTATLHRPELDALVGGRGVVPAYADEALRVAVHQALASTGGVLAAWLGPWAGTDARLTVLVADSDPAAVAPRLVRALPDDLRARAVRGVDVELVTERPDPPPGRPVFVRTVS